MKESETQALMEKIKGVYSRLSINEISVEIWQKVLKNITYDKSYKAFIQYVATEGSYDPKPGDILRLANSMQEPIPINDKVSCDKCHGTGLMFLIDQHKHESVGACNCTNGLIIQGLPRISILLYEFDGLGRVKA